MQTTNRIKEFQQEFRSLADPDRAEKSGRFFKTGPGEYGEGDLFLGIAVPVIRKMVRQFRGLSLDEALKILTSEYHEERLFALLLMVEQYKRGCEAEKKAVFDGYLRHKHYVNGWDLVDSSAHLIIGPYLMDKDRSLLYSLAVSDSLWDRRIAVMSTFHFVKQNEFDETLKIAEELLNDSEDLIHKAVGWMLREIGNRNKKIELAFLKRHYQEMPRTMLRYAIEKFPPTERKAFLRGNI